MITEFDISKVELQCNIGEKSGMDDHFDIGRVFEIGKFDITRLTCISWNSKQILSLTLSQLEAIFPPLLSLATNLR